MDFNWNEPRTIDDQEFSSDNLDRAKYAISLTSLIKAKGGTEKNNLSNYVLNLDAEWGAGKTYFLKRWSEDLKGNHPVVYIDAWSIDYLESPLMTVLSEIIEQLKTQTDRADSPKAKAKFKEIIKAAAPRVGSALMKRYLGFDLDVFNSSEPETGNSSNKDIDFSKAGEKVLEVFCKEVTDSKESVKALKQAIQAWVEYVVDNPVQKMVTIKNSYPAFIFIDELDRCKPTYAVEMLEAIKHVFDIPGLAFVVATNTTQLRYTVKAVYGSEFDAETYLSRFFDNKYYLRSNVTKELLFNYHSQSVYNLETLVERGIILFPFINFNSEVFLKLSSNIFNELNIPPRQSVKILHRVELIVSTVPNDTTLDIPLLLCLCALMEVGQNKLNQAVEQLRIGDQKQSGVFGFSSKIKLDISIFLRTERKIYRHISNQQLKYESSNKEDEDADIATSKTVTLFDYLFMFKRRFALGGSQGEKTHKHIISCVQNYIKYETTQSERIKLNDELKELRVDLLFYIFNNYSNFDFYQELVEISANLD